MTDHSPLESILDECLARMQAGESLEACLESYPQWAEELRPLLELGTMLQTLAVPAAHESARTATEARIRTQAQTAPRPVVILPLYARIRAGWQQILIVLKEMFIMKKAFTTLVLLVALLFGGGTLTAFASQSALPGDALYTVKTALEDARLSMTTSHASAARLALQLSERRVQELSALAQAGRYQDMQTATQRLQAHLQTAQQSLEVLAHSNPAQAQAIAVLLTKAQQSEQQVVASLESNAPVAARTAITQAKSALQDAARTASTINAQVAQTGNQTGSQMDETPPAGSTITTTVTTEPSDTPEPGETITPTVTVTATMTVTPTTTMTPTMTVTVTETAEPTETPEPTET
ncbi:MAG: hypothetical protein D6755_12440, partial [Anaerolineae bacterium]